MQKILTTIKTKMPCPSKTWELSALGFSPFFEEQISSEKAIIARISAEHRGGYHVWSNAGEGFVQLAGRLTQELEKEAFPGVGDWVILKSPPDPDQISVIESVLKRRTVLVRGAAGNQAKVQVIAANIDIVFLVCGLDLDYNIRRIERYLARIWASGAKPVIILNKADICENVEERIAEVKAVCIGAEVLVTSALRSEGLDKIRPYILAGITIAFVGSSGTGKSTLINALLGEERMATNKIRASDGKGRHTTSHRQMIIVPEGGLLIDTPGVRELQLFNEDGIDTVFADIKDLSARCRFRDCSHESEPGCAIKDAIKSGKIPAERLSHYLKMEKEAQAYELRNNQALKRKADRDLGRKMAVAVARVRDWKSGK